MIKELAIVTSEEQRLVIQQTTTHAAHLDFIGTHFIDKPQTSLYLRNLSQIPTQQTPDYFRLLTLVATQAAQYGFEPMWEAMGHHKIKNPEISYFDPRRQIAQASYLATINVQAYNIKLPLVEKLMAVDTETAPKIWQMALSVEDGKVVNYRLDRPLEVLHAMMGDVQVREPICLTDLDLNNRLAGLPFSAQLAEIISLNSFRRLIKPGVQAILGDLLDVGKATAGFRPV